ncbi:MAG: hypothetical protein AB7S71_13615 [Dongiaceae bacterium]
MQISEDGILAPAATKAIANAEVSIVDASTRLPADEAGPAEQCGMVRPGNFVDRKHTVGAGIRKTFLEA